MRKFFRLFFLSVFFILSSTPFLFAYDEDDAQRSVKPSVMTRLWLDILKGDGEIRIEKKIANLGILEELAAKKTASDTFYEYKREREELFTALIIDIRELRNELKNYKPEISNSAQLKRMNELTKKINSKIFAVENYEKAISDFKNEKLLKILFMLVFFIILFLTIIVILFLVNSNNLDRLLFQKNYNALCLKIQENERKFLSHELHDTVAQDLKGIQFITAELSKPGNLNERKIIELSHRADSTAKKAITNVRTLCYNLTPPELECNNLAEALATTCANFTNETNVECPLVITNKDFINSFDKDSQLYIFRIVNEALENIKKHAEAEEASVILREELKSNKNSKFPVKYLTLMIFDDGNGFDVKSYITEISINGNLNVEKSNKNSSHYKNSEKNNQIRHFGLRGIIDRVNTLGGKLEIKSAEGEGTEIKISIPYRRREKNEKHRSAR